MANNPKPYACFDRPPFRTSYKAQDGYWDDGLQRIPKLTSIPFRMNPDCQYTHTALGAADGRCVSCKHKTLNDGKVMA